MSRDADEERRPPRPRSKPRLPAADLPPTDPDESAPSTFRPSPRREARREPPMPETEADGASTFRPGRPPSGKSKGAKREARPVEGGPGWVERIVFGRVSTGHLALFCRQFGAYLEAGVDLLRSLDSLQGQFARTALGPVLDRVKLGVRRGDSLSDAMRREPGAFDSQFLAMMGVAEARGGVPETMKMLASGYEARQRLFRQARSAMIYPIAVLTVAFGVGMLLTVFILPGLVGMMEEMVRERNLAVPLPARVLMAINGFMIHAGWYVVPIAAFGSVFGLIWMYRRPKGKAFLDEIAMRLPVLGKLFRMIDTTRFARTLSVLLEAGVDIGESLDLTAATMNLVPFRRAVARSREAVMEGAELSETLRDSRRFPADVLAFIESGEETGKLPETLDRLADDYEERVEFLVKNLGSLIQPVIFVFLGGVVLFIALAFFSVYIMLLTGL